MSPGLVGTVQDSKAKRQERLKSRFRDRGGIFVPAEGNALAQLLLARGVNGESPAKRRSPRKSTVARPTAPKSARSAKVATKTPRAASKRARKSTVVPDADTVDENTTLPQPRIAPASTKKNKRRSTSKSKTPKSRSSQRSRPRTKEVDFDGGSDVDAAPPVDSAGPSSPHAPMRPKSLTNRLADALNSAADQCPPDSCSTPVKPSRHAPSAPSMQGMNEEVIDEGTAAGLPSPGVGRAARRGARGGDCDSSDRSDQPLAQKLAKTAPADSRPKSGKRPGTKGARPPPARGKRTGSKAKAAAKRTAVAVDDGDGDEQPKRTESAITRTQTGGATASTGDTAGREAPKNPRKRGAEEGRGHEETASLVAPPRGGEDVPDVVLPPTKRARVSKEKGAPRKRKKNVDDGNDVSTGAGTGAIRTTNNENGPPTKKRQRADPKTATAVRYVIIASTPAVLRCAPHVPCVSRVPRPRWLHSSVVFLFIFTVFIVAYSFFFVRSRHRRGKENENGIKPGSGTKDKPLPSPAGAHRKTTSKGKPPSRPGTRARSRGLPPDVLRRIRVNAQTLAGPQDIDDDDPIDFLRS